MFGEEAYTKQTIMCVHQDADLEQRHYWHGPASEVSDGYFAPACLQGLPGKLPVSPLHSTHPNDLYLTFLLQTLVIAPPLLRHVLLHGSPCGNFP